MSWDVSYTFEYPPVSYGKSRDPIFADFGSFFWKVQEHLMTNDMLTGSSITSYGIGQEFIIEFGIARWVAGTGLVEAARVAEDAIHAAIIEVGKESDEATLMLVEAALGDAEIELSRRSEAPQMAMLAELSRLGQLMERDAT